MSENDLTRLSKFISFALRHRPEQIDLTLDREGWAEIDALIKGSAEKRGIVFSRETVLEVVRTDEKGRYQISDDGKKIRAVQGHSHSGVKIANRRKSPPALLFHGTAEKSLSAIMKKGLLPMTRQQVHLSPDAETALTVGRRHGKPVIFEVLAGDMARDGYAFFVAENGVWLTDTVPAKYLRRTP